MKFYATIESVEGERGGSRPAKKGSNEQLNITLYRGNREIGLLTFSSDEVALEMYNAEPWCEHNGENNIITLPHGAVMHFPWRT